LISVDVLFVIARTETPLMSHGGHAYIRVSGVIFVRVLADVLMGRAKRASGSAGNAPTRRNREDEPRAQKLLAEAGRKQAAAEP
jgi:hypothetical protein